MNLFGNIQHYSIVDEAENFVKQLGKEVELAPEAANWEASKFYNRKMESTTSTANHLGILVANFKKYKDMYLRISELSQQGDAVAINEKARLAAEFLTRAQELVTFKDLLQNHHLLIPGKQVLAELAETRELLKKEQAAREIAERRANEAEKREQNLNVAYEEVKTQLESITGRVKHDLGEENGEKWITEALLFDPKIIENEVESTEDGKGV